MTIDASAKVSEAVQILNQAAISQIPVTENGEFVGSLSDTSILNRLIEEPEIKTTSIREVMEAPFPIVDSHLTVSQMSSKLGKDTKALLVRDEKGDFQIITRSDLLVAVAS
jgi:cystathionine beta-synthase